jgi:hypothetical protein
MDFMRLVFPVPAYPFSRNAHLSLSVARNLPRAIIALDCPEVGSKGSPFFNSWTNSSDFSMLQLRSSVRALVGPDGPVNLYKSIKTKV